MGERLGRAQGGKSSFEQCGVGGGNINTKDIYSIEGIMSQRRSRRRRQIVARCSMTYIISYIFSVHVTQKANKKQRWIQEVQQLFS